MQNLLRATVENGESAPVRNVAAFWHSFPSFDKPIFVLILTGKVKVVCNQTSQTSTISTQQICNILFAAKKLLRAHIFVYCVTFLFIWEKNRYYFSICIHCTFNQLLPASRIDLVNYLYILLCIIAVLMHANMPNI